MTNSPILYVETTYAIADAGVSSRSPSAPPRPCEAGTSAGQAESLAQKRNRLARRYKQSRSYADLYALRQATLECLEAETNA